MAGWSAGAAISATLRSRSGTNQAADPAKPRVVEYFVLGVPIYRLRFRGPATLHTLKRNPRLIPAVLAIHEQCRAKLAGTLESDETL